MVCIVYPVDDLSHTEFQAFEVKQHLHLSCGFVDGNLVESFWDLDCKSVEMAVRDMNKDGYWIRIYPSVVV